jgi:hypothetical protein
MPARTFTFLFLAPLLPLLLLAPSARADHPTGGVAGGGAGAINTVGAETMPESLWSISLRLDLIDLKTFSNVELADFAADDVDTHSADRVVVPSINVAYGVSDDLTVGARLPYVSTQDVREPSLEGGVPGSESLGDSEGLGDVTLFGEYRFARETPERPAFAVLGGLKMPTGEEHEHTDEGKPFETEFQPGSGSWDPLLGLAATKTFGRASLSANVLYILANDGSQHTNLGDVLNYNLGWAYRVNGPEPHDHGAMEGGHDHAAHEHPHEAALWDVILELNGVWHEEQTIDGQRDENSGGNRLFLAPGVRMTVDERWSAFASVGVPLFEHVNGAEHETDVHAVMGVSVSF